MEGRLARYCRLSLGVAGLVAAYGFLEDAALLPARDAEVNAGVQP